MREKRAQIRTILSVRDCEEVFKAAATAPLLGKGRLARHFSKSLRPEFFTPHDTPFSMLNEDKEEFAVGCTFTVALGTQVAIHMYVWDRDEFREAVLVVPHDAGGAGGAERFLNKFISGFHDQDSAAEVVVE